MKTLIIIITRKIIVCIILTLFYGKIIQSYKIKGDWEPWLNCSKGTFVIGMQLEYSEDPLTNIYDQLEAINFFCGWGNGSKTVTQTLETIEYREAYVHHDPKTPSYCPKYVLGIEILKQSSDIIKLDCDDGSSIQHKLRSKSSEIQGSSKGYSKCLDFESICGIRTKSTSRGSQNSRGLGDFEFSCCHCAAKEDWELLLDFDNIGSQKDSILKYDKILGGTWKTFGSNKNNNGKNMTRVTGGLEGALNILISYEIRHSSNNTKGHHYNWESGNRQFHNKTVQVQIVPGGRRVKVFQLIGVCNSYMAKTDVFRTEIWDSNGLLSSTITRSSNSLELPSTASYSDRVVDSSEDTTAIDRNIKPNDLDITFTNSQLYKIIVISVIFVAVLALIGTLVIFLVRKLRRSKKPPDTNIETNQIDTELRPLVVNRMYENEPPNNNVFTEPEIKRFLEGNAEVLGTQKLLDAAELIDSLPYNKKFEIPRKDIHCDELIGGGNFGKVYKGRVSIRKSPSNSTNAKEEEFIVAVKTVKSTENKNDFIVLLSELKIMAYVGEHENVANLICACTENISRQELFIAIEYCHYGSMESFMGKDRASFIDFMENDTFILPKIEETKVGDEVNGTPRISTVNLLKWCREISHGMDFLGSKKIIHADLATRNIMLTKMLSAKIGDFGLSKQLLNYSTYVKARNIELPWRWMDPTSLLYNKFSIQSDIWAFGITVWEIFTLAQIPYPGIAWNDKFCENLTNGLRPSKPKYACSKIYEKLLECWDSEPNKRPPFVELKNFFDNFLIGDLTYFKPDIMAEDNNGYLLPTPIKNKF